MAEKDDIAPNQNKYFTEIEIAILSLNLNIVSVTTNQLNYKDSFKFHFLPEHVAIEPLLQTFQEAGIRLKNAWTRSY